MCQDVPLDSQKAKAARGSLKHITTCRRDPVKDVYTWVFHIIFLTYFIII